jgi:hypothetical protein
MAKIRVRYLLIKGGTLYYNRRIPDDLRSHYPPSREFHRVPLHTSDPLAAASLISALSAKDDALFRSLRSGEEVPPQSPKTSSTLKATQSDAVLLSTARARYLIDHKRSLDPRVTRDVNRAIDFVISVAGDLPLPSYTRYHAREIRDKLIPGHSTATVRRHLDSISAGWSR